MKGKTVDKVRAELAEVLHSAFTFQTTAQSGLGAFERMAAAAVEYFDKLNCADCKSDRADTPNG